MEPTTQGVAGSTLLALRVLARTLRDAIHELALFLRDSGPEVGGLVHLADLEQVTVLCRTTSRPLDRFGPRLHLPHPVAADHLACFGKGPIGHRPLRAVEA